MATTTGAYSPKLNSKDAYDDSDKIVVHNDHSDKIVNNGEARRSGSVTGPALHSVMPPDPDEGKSPEERAAIEKALLRKLDWRLIPWLSFLYLISFLDRTNIGNARIYGLQRDLKMSDSGYAASLTVFFVSYALLEPLTNILLKVMRPSIFIPLTMFTWGICMITMGLVHNTAGMITARFFLGVTEAGLFPGVQYYLSCWYRRGEFGIRSAIFFSAAAFAGSFGGLLAAAIAKMDGIGGKRGWAWIFILEGLATLIVGIASYWLVHDFPTEAKFLTAEDKQRVIRRLAEDQQASSRVEKFNRAYLWEAFKDWKTYMFAIIYMGTDGSLYAFSLFLPTIIRELGYSATRANLLSVPPYAGGAIATILVGWYADKTRKRGLINIGMSLFGIVGFIMLLAAPQPGVRYAGTFLGALGIYPTIANTIVWCSNNIEGTYKRGVVMGVVIGWGNLNGIVASNIYPSKTGPRYIPGHATVLAYLTVFLLGGSIVTTLLLRRENANRLAGKRDHWHDLPHEQKEIMGDKNPDFIYVV